MAPPTKKKQEPAADPNGDDVPRRSFLERASAVLIGVFIGLVPLAAGAYTFFDPLRKKKQAKWVRVALLDEVPNGGAPVRFPVITDRWDAWNYYPPEPVSGVYLRRTSPNEDPVAFSVVCPHLGCSVDFAVAESCFKCPCHKSVFEPDGSVRSGPPPRPLDTLEVEIRPGDQGDEVWVNYQKFKAGHTDKEPE
jgi:menaquinol-cytochrome c reductase iron-sulfur subunit